jgi:succinate dehydrogenase flavin-adding protein (antitoxin of CptAB toxin-antitoxin module)
MDDYAINDKFLEEAGILIADPVTRLSKIDYLMGKLETMVSNKIAHELSEEDLNELERLMESDGEEDPLEWLVEKFPQYRAVVQAQYNKLQAELKSKGL